MKGACRCWASNHALGHGGHCCFTHGDRKVNGGWRTDEQICHAPSDIVIRSREGTLTGPLATVHNAEDAAREIDRLLPQRTNR